MIDQKDNRDKKQNKNGLQLTKTKEEEVHIKSKINDIEFSQLNMDESKSDQQKKSQCVSPLNSNNNIFSQFNDKTDSQDLNQKRNSKCSTAEQQPHTSPFQTSARGFINNQSMLSFSQPQSLLDNNLLILDEESSYGDETQVNKDILSEIGMNNKDSQRASIDIQNEKSNKIDIQVIRPFFIFLKSLMFISKLMRGASSFQFRKITQKQFGLIDDFSSDFEYYVYVNPKIRSFVKNFIIDYIGSVIYSFFCIIIETFNYQENALLTQKQINLSSIKKLVYYSTNYKPYISQICKIFNS